MDLYTLDSLFGPAVNVDEFISAIWTERYSAAGDLQLVVPATADNVDVLREGTKLGLRGSNRVMEIETQSIKNKLLTLTGNDVLGFLDQRMMWNANPFESDVNERVKDFVVDGMSAADAVAGVVYNMIGNSSSFPFPTSNGSGLDVNKEFILGLHVRSEAGGDETRTTFTIGPLYTSVAQVAVTEGLGIRMYIDYEPDFSETLDGVSRVLIFESYYGVDRSSDQDENEVVRLSAEFDTISNLEEVVSIAEYKNVCYVYFKGEISKHLADPDADEPIGFDRRVLLTNAEGEPPGRKPSLMNNWQRTVGPYAPAISSGEDAAFREQNARDALANHNYIRALDGEVSPTGERFGEDYDLGDIIELESPTGTIQRARVTEHIRAQDNLGEKEYPTISVIT